MYNIKKIISELSNNELVSKSVRVLLLRVLGVLLFFSTTLFITNFFDPETVGKYDFTRSTLIILGGLSVIGMNQSIIYYSGYLVSNNAFNHLKQLYTKMIIIIFCISLTLGLLFILINDDFINSFFDKQVSNLILKAVATIFFYGLTMLNIDVFRAINKIYISELYRNVFRFVFFFLAVIGVYYTNNSNWLVDVFLLNFLLLAIVSTSVLLFYFNKINLNDSTFHFSYKTIIKRSWPMAISTIALVLMQSVDVILLGKFTDFETVAYYSAAIKLTTIISLVLTSVNAVFAPKIAELYSNKDFLNLNLNLKKATRLIFILTIPGIVLLAVFSTVFLSFFGEGYMQAKNALIILLLGQTVNALCGSVGVYMNMTGKQNTLQIILIISFLLNLVLNWLLIPLYGMIGAAIATSISMVLWNITGTIYLLKTDKIKTFLN